MADSFIRYTGDGATSEFSVPFPYIDREHVDGYIDGVNTDLEWINSGSVVFASTPPQDSDVFIQRNTPRTPLVDFEGGAIITESDLDLLTKQNIYLSEETRDNALTIEEGGRISANFARLVELGPPSEPRDAVTKEYADEQKELVQGLVNEAEGYANTAEPVSNVTDEIQAVADRKEAVQWLYDSLQGAVYTSDLGSIEEPITDSMEAPESYIVSVYNNREAIKAAPKAADDAAAARDQAQYWAEQAEQSANFDTLDFGSL